MPYIGIDFGTSNSVVANFQYGQAEVLPNPEGQKWTPSVVTMRRDGSLSFGQEAKENFDEQRSIRSIKRILGSGERVPFVGQNLRTEQVAVMLFSKLKHDAEAGLGESITKVVVTIPANSKGLARHATKLCAGAAGLQVLTLINEPTAAAITYGLNAKEDQTVMVYDFGGGTLDVTLLRIHHGIFEEISSKGIGKLGGDDLDAALGNLLAKRFQEKTGYDILNSPYKTQFMLAVEKAKIELSTAPTAVCRKAELVPERHLSLEEEIDRQSFEKEIMSLVVKSGTAIDEALSLRGMKPKDVDRVLLVGGTSKIPLIRRFVSEKLAGKEPEPFEKVDPMTCVAQGAAIVSAILQGAPGLDNNAYSVKLEHSLCANPINERRQVYLDPIVKRGVDIPCSFTKIYHPVADPAERVIISVFEGDVYDDPNHAENVKLAEIPWEFQPPRTQKDAALEVTYEYGDDGILTVQIHDMHTGHKKRFAIQQTGQDQMDAGQIMRMKRINEDLMKKSEDLENTPEYRDALEILKKTEQDVVPKVEDPTDKRELEDLCRQVREAMASGDRKRMEEASSALNDRLLNYAYLLQGNAMLQCPQCTKPLRELVRRCPTCQADLDLLVDYVSHLQGGLERAENLVRAGELGQAVWAYLEVLEVDPDNVSARRQVTQVATAVRQFDYTVPGRRWANNLPPLPPPRLGIPAWLRWALLSTIVVLAFSAGMLFSRLEWEWPTAAPLPEQPEIKPVIKPNNQLSHGRGYVISA